jgi:hypothetical protein
MTAAVSALGNSIALDPHEMEVVENPDDLAFDGGFWRKKAFAGSSMAQLILRRLNHHESALVLALSAEYADAGRERVRRSLALVQPVLGGREGVSPAVGTFVGAH